MTIAWLIYASSARVAAGADLSAMVSAAQHRNATIDITGALIFTGTRFAQYLEGPEAALDALMDSIHIDSRHSDIVVIGSGTTPQRRFAQWSMAYAGPSVFVDRTVERSLAEDTRHDAPRALIRLMQEFVRR